MRGADTDGSAAPQRPPQRAPQAAQGPAKMAAEHDNDDDEDDDDDPFSRGLIATASEWSPSVPWLL